MLFGDDVLKPLADLAKAAVRSTANFNWSFIAIFAFVVMIYVDEIHKKNYKAIAAALMLYSVHWLYEIFVLIMGGFLLASNLHMVYGLRLVHGIVFAIGSALMFSLVEIFLASTPAFIWVYKWWGAIPVFITTYIPFFLASYLIYDKEPKTQKKWIISLSCVNIVLLAVLIPLGII